MLEPIELAGDERQLTVDTAHLLTNHDSRSAIVGTPDSWNREAVPHTGEITRATRHLELLGVNDIGVVKVPGSDDGMSSQFYHGLESSGVLAVLHKPTGRLGTEEDANGKDEGWDKG